MSYTKEEFLNEVRPLGEELINYAMTAGKTFGITDVEFSASVGEKQKNSIEEGDVTEVVSGSSCGVTVTLYAGDRVMTFSKNTMDKETLKRAIEDNMQVIHLVPENLNKRLLEKEKIYNGPEVDLDLSDSKDIDQETLIDYAKKMETGAKSNPAVKTARDISVEKHKNHSFVLATNGLDSYEGGGWYQAVVSAIVEDESGMQVDYDWATVRHFEDMPDPEELGQTSAKNAVAKLNSSLPKTGEMPVVLDQDAAKSFFSSVFSSIDGTAVHKGVTFMKDKVGKQVMSKEITIIDNPRIKRGLSSSFVDGSGMETKEITFIKDGVLQSFNVSLEEARQLGIDPIGRDDGKTNTTILPGSKTPEELMSDIKEGIYIKGFNGGTVDVNNGTHSRQAYGLLIKDGKVTNQAVSGFVVSGNLKEMFMNVVLANDTPKQPGNKGSMAAPTIRINGVTIAGQ